MKNIIALSLTLVITVILHGQADNRQKEKYHVLSGARHGVNFFPRAYFDQVQYEAGEDLTFDKYHSAEVIYTWLERWAEKYPDLIDLYKVGESYEGRPVWQITLTNKKTGKDTDKPAAFFEGGRHSGEITGTESVLWLIKYLLENYGKDAEVTQLIDTRAIYLKPINNPDGHLLYVKTAQNNRSTVRPDDNDGDGLYDEDAPEDLDGDGRILTMRWKDEKKGNLIPDPKDPSGKIMKRVDAGKGIYLSASEGIDSDNDGRINEDGIGGLDLHRNYPENWRPRQELTGRGFTQGGAGEYPLSEPETKAVVAFLLTHPNISVVNSMDTSVPMHLRPPSTSSSEDRMYPEDLKWYELFDELGKKITGYERAGDVYDDYGSGNPLFGHGPDFGYFYYGAIWYGDELWNGARFKDYNGDSLKNEIDMLMWDEEANGGEGFIEWKPAKHPVYGDIEIGGFDLKFFSQNPPARHLEPWVKNEAIFNIEMMKHMAILEWNNIEVSRIKAYKTDSADYSVRVSFRNTGKLPTALKQAELVKIVRPDRVELSLDTAGASKGKPGYRFIPDEKASRAAKKEKSDRPQRTVRPGPSVNVPVTEGGAVTTATYYIRLYNRSELKGKASVYSTRGGVLKDREFVIR